jgi:hypothetical protein
LIKGNDVDIGQPSIGRIIDLQKGCGPRPKLRTGFPLKNEFLKGRFEFSQCEFCGGKRTAVMQDD